MDIIKSLNTLAFHNMKTTKFISKDMLGSECFECHVSLLFLRFLQYFYIYCKCYESIEKTEDICHHAKLETKNNRIDYMFGKISYYSPILLHLSIHIYIHLLYIHILFNVFQYSTYILYYT